MSKKTIAKGSQIEVLLEDDKCYKIFNNDYSIFRNLHANMFFN